MSSNKRSANRGGRPSAGGNSRSGPGGGPGGGANGGGRGLGGASGYGGGQSGNENNGYSSSGRSAGYTSPSQPSRSGASLGTSFSLSPNPGTVTVVTPSAPLPIKEPEVAAVVTEEVENSVTPRPPNAFESYTGKPQEIARPTRPVVTTTLAPPTPPPKPPLVSKIDNPIRRTYSSPLLSSAAQN